MVGPLDVGGAGLSVLLVEQERDKATPDDDGDAEARHV